MNAFAAMNMQIVGFSSILHWLKFALIQSYCWMFIFSEIILSRAFLAYMCMHTFVTLAQNYYSRCIKTDIANFLLCRSNIGQSFISNYCGMKKNYAVALCEFPVHVPLLLSFLVFIKKQSRACILTFKSRIQFEFLQKLKFTRFVLKTVHPAVLIDKH